MTWKTYSCKSPQNNIMANQFLLNIQSEFLKCRHTAALWLTLMAAAFLPAINCLILVAKPTVFVAQFQQQPWISFLRMNWKNGASVILPVFVILLNNVIVQVEYKNNTWKQVYASPRKYADIFFSKFIIVQLFLLGFFLLFSLFIILSGYTISLLQKDYPFSSSAVPFRYLFILITRIYVAILGVSAIQYWLSVRFRNFIVPLGVGIGLWIAGLILMDWENIIYYPYMYSTLLFFIDAPKHVGTLPLLLTNSVVCFLVAISLGFRNIYSLKQRG
jgi:hypothetical protein